ncbi:surface-adhesin E family protein [Ralstonia pseudosolanacearum]|uniref:surface-adhesin E family protein n=1 Tax=Ralstonia pseudosolanacearum TaxID=1310165 RepID=UPI0007D85B3B|nr:surface-adhesin E family protein [Ralstonia pseudosolanacearum]MDC6296218.1 hypothetical protein [Ralstonia pseudosolanacearum]MDD7791809.1 hypothetical protein [Ralstonia pseudosolanacearum]MDN3368846.1 hypothetical protein [Ralstonia pseudosolanacearum]OAK92995.1 hypothetical protein AB851_02175 [Ralstonia pseudosolanacearum]QOK87887.1 hypothetical protein HF907_15300 [Ralstonia pseudosolanacearum]
MPSRYIALTVSQHVCVVIRIGICTFAAQAVASDWFSYNQSSKFGHLLADKQELVRNGDTVKLWSAQAPVEVDPSRPVYTKSVYVIDCKQHTFRIAQSTAYGADERGVDIPVSPQSREVEPDSQEDALASFACDGGKNFWMPVTGVQEFFNERRKLAKQRMSY